MLNTIEHLTTVIKIKPEIFRNCDACLWRLLHLQFVDFLILIISLFTFSFIIVGIFGI